MMGNEENNTFIIGYKDGHLITSSSGPMNHRLTKVKNHWVKSILEDCAKSKQQSNVQ